MKAEMKRSLTEYGLIRRALKSVLAEVFIPLIEN